jgi:hypothetical protein
MADASRVSVACQPGGSGWQCRVIVGDDPGATTHEVTVTADDLDRLGASGASPEAIVATSFAFLLEREPRESILRAFALSEIGRYFPEYPSVIGERLRS